MLVAAVCLGWAVTSVPVHAQSEEEGETLYRAWCAECHGETGEGDGPAAEYMLPRPRDFSAARYQVRTTGSGELPTDRDIMAVLEEGMPGTTMPGWRNFSRSERESLRLYLKSLSRFFGRTTPEPMEFSDDPGGGDEALASGREAYEALECVRCHGEAGRGDGRSAPTLEDWRGLPIAAADLSEPWLFNGGASVEAIHTRLLTGLDGTPMPAASDALRAGIVSEEQLWHLAHYVRSLAPEQVPPRVRDAIRVRRAEGALPDGIVDPGHEAWAESEPYYIPLGGQIIEQPRSFAPMIDGLWVRAIHDGEDLALHVSWSDPSRSPDPDWREWQEKVAGSLHPDGTPIPVEPLPDAVAVQFPFEVPEGRERPYFLMGDSRNPVYLWRWASESRAFEARATGLGTSQPLQPASGISGEAVWERGRWQVTFRRSLAVDQEAGTTFPEGVAVPVAFFAWDGSSGETGPRGSVSSWYFAILEEPASRTVYVAPVLAILLTAGFGLLAIRRTREDAAKPRRES